MSQPKLSTKKRNILYKYFTIISLCRQDLQDICPAHLLEKISDEDMEWLADQMGEDFAESGMYWDTLKTHSEDIIKLTEERYYEKMPKKELPLHINDKFLSGESKSIIERRLKN